MSRIASERGRACEPIEHLESRSTQGPAQTVRTRSSNDPALQEAHQRQLEELYAEIGRLTTQVNWLKKKSGLNLGEK